MEGSGEEPGGNSMMRILSGKSSSGRNCRRALVCLLLLLPLAGQNSNGFYDGEGRRVRRSSGGRETVYGYGAGGQLRVEWEVAALPPTRITCTTWYYEVDHWGSTRTVAASDGTVEKRTDYVPFGEEAPAGWSGRTEAMKYELEVAARWNPQKVRFAGKERDAETANSAMPSGVDYFGIGVSLCSGRAAEYPNEAGGECDRDDVEGWQGCERRAEGGGRRNDIGQRQQSDQIQVQGGEGGRKLMFGCGEHSSASLRMRAARGRRRI